jgi:hypothetical protein
MKTIKYFRLSQYGHNREFIHPDHSADAAILLRLTGKRTIDNTIRELVTGLTDGHITFEETIAPK